MNFLPGKHGFYEEDQFDGSSSSHRGVSEVVSRPVVEKEHMFDKVVTPSDVGKLNRLVIPKQHAERYFPLDSSTNDKGLLLNFEDRNGKQWRFRYSYWNSSQSYVMTKGWSRFVKEKKLDAGDVVSFQRGALENTKDRLFIDFRRRPEAPEYHHHSGNNPVFQPSFSLPNHFSFQRNLHPWNPLFLHPQPQQQQFINRTVPPYNYNSGSVIYFRQAAHQGNGNMSGIGNGTGITAEPVVFDSVPVVQGKAAAKRLRLFGVNMECPITDSDECEILSSTSIPLHHQYSSSSSSSIPYLQLRPYNGTPIQTLPQTTSQTNFNYLDKDKSSSLSLDLDI